MERVCRDANFRSAFQAAIVSISRAGQQLKGKLGDVELKAGDRLLFDAGPGFDAQNEKVKANLEMLAADMEQQEREFMFAFQVEGTLLLVSTSHVQRAFCLRGIATCSVLSACGALLTAVAVQ